MLQATRALIHVDRFRANILNIREKIGPNCGICLALKADAYGHGAIALAHEAEKTGTVTYVGVATVPEGIELREAGIRLPILKFSPCLPDEILPAIQHNITLTAADQSFAREIDRISAKMNRKTDIHVKIDTGMGRIGFSEKTAVPDILEVSSCENILIKGIYTHFPSSDEKNKEFSLDQVHRFSEICGKLSENGLEIPLKHMANSGAILDIPVSYMDMVRPGIMLYGYPPSRDVSASVGIEPVMTLVSRVNFMKRFYPGETVSYGRTHKIEKETVIATLPVGYADGYSRLLSGKGRVIIRDHFYPQVGRVTMDQIMIDVGPDPEFSIGEPVIVMGKSKNLIFDAFDMAELTSTISYEITCNISKRVPRVYINEKTSDLY